MSMYVDTVEFETHTCGACGVVFAMTTAFKLARQKDRKTWYCPNGDPRVFNGQSEADKLRAELARKEEILDAERQRAARAVRELDGITRAHKRMRTRVMNGVCPCCNRQFQNLLRHMRTEHQGEFNLKNVRTAFGMSQAQLADEIGVRSIHISLMENGKEPVQWAKEAIDNWVSRQDSGKATA